MKDSGLRQPDNQRIVLPAARQPNGYMSVPRPESDEDLRSNQIADYWTALKRTKWVAVKLLLLGVLAGGAYSLKEPMVFRARATLEVQNVNEEFMRMRDVDPQAGSYTASNENIMTQLNILESGSLKSRVLERMDREATPLPPPPEHYLSKIRNKIKRQVTDPIQMANDGAILAAGTLVVSQVPQTRIIDLQCQSNHPLIAATFLNTLAAEYADQTLDERVKSIQQTGRWLSSRLEDIKVKLENAEQKLSEHVRSSGLNIGPQQETLAQAKIRQLHLDLSTIQAERAAKQSRWETAKNSPPDSLPAEFDAALLPYRQQLATLRTELAAVSTTLTSMHPKVQAIQTQIRETENALQKERESSLARIKADYDNAVRQEQLLGSAYGAQSGRVVSETDKHATYELLKREVDNARELHNVLLQQVNQSGVAAAMTVNQVRVVDPAIPNPRPYRPNPVRNMTLGAMGGLVLALAFAFWEAHDDGKLRSPHHARQLNISELTFIPPKPEQKRLLQRADKIDFNHLDTGEVPELGSSLYSESLRLALASLQFATQSLTRSPVILVTSPNPNEGKTTISSNLAIAMNEMGKRVLLIDLDLRKPRLHEVFNLTNERGMAAVLESDEAVDEVKLVDLVRTTKKPGLSILVAGKASKGPQTLLHSTRFQALLERLRERYDAILIDSPPATLFPDARIIAAHSDGVIMVLRAGVTDRADAIALKDRFASDGIPLFGAVLNDVEMAGTPYHRGYINYYSAEKRS